MTDAHIHIGRSAGKRLGGPYESSIRSLLGQYAALAITNLRDGGDDLMLGGLARAIAPEYGIRLLTPLAALSRTGGYGAFLGRQAADKTELCDIMAALLKRKPDFIKIIQSGIVSFDNPGEVSAGGFEPELYSLIAKTARDNGLRLMVHVNGADNIMRVLEYGADSIEHGYFISERELRAMAESNVAWVPTLAPLSNYLSRCENGGRQAEVVRKILAGQKSAIKKALELGVSVGIGSDSGAAFVPHGQGTYDEMRLFGEAGLLGEGQQMRQMRV